MVSNNSVYTTLHTSCRNKANCVNYKFTPGAFGISRNYSACGRGESDDAVAETALLALEMHHPSMLVTDVNLAGKVDGLQLARIARSNDPKMRVVVVSGQPPASALPDGVAFFSKPFYPVELLREVTH